MSLDHKRSSWISDSPPSRRGRSPFQKGTFLRQDDHTPRPGGLTQLLSRSHQSFHNYGSSWRGAVSDDEEALLAHSTSSHGFVEWGSAKNSVKKNSVKSV